MQIMLAFQNGNRVVEVSLYQLPDGKIEAIFPTSGSSAGVFSVDQVRALYQEAKKFKALKRVPVSEGELIAAWNKTEETVTE